MGRSFGVLCAAAILLQAVGARAGEVYAWDQDTSVWTSNFNAISSLGVLEESADRLHLVVDSSNRLVITYDQDTNSWNERNFVVRHDGSEAVAWNETAGVWTNDLSQGSPIEQWDARMDDSRLIAGQDGSVTMIGQTDEGVSHNLFTVRITDDSVSVWDSATGWTADSDKADPINRGAKPNTSLPIQAMATDTNNNAYCAYYETDFSSVAHFWLTRVNETDVRIWNGGSWSTTLTGGTPLDQGAGSGTACSLGSDSSGNIYIMLGYDGGTYLQRYDGANLEAWDTTTTSWTNSLMEGDSVDRGGSAATPQQMVVDGNDHVYMLTEETSATPNGTNDYYLSRYDGTDVRIWDHDATGWTTNFSNGDPIEPQIAGAKLYFGTMAADPQGGVYFTCYRLDSSPDELYLVHCDGGSVTAWNQASGNWTSVLSNATPLHACSEVYTHDLAVNGDGSVYVSHKDNDKDGIYLLRHDGTDVRTWDQDSRSWVANLSQGDALGAAGEWASTPKVVTAPGNHIYTLFKGYPAGGANYVPLLSHCGTVSGIPSLAEISPTEVFLSTQDQAFSYFVNTPSESAFAQVDKIEVAVPVGYSDVTVTGVFSNGNAVAYTNNTSGNALSVTLSSPVPAGSGIVRVDFTADVTATPGPEDFTSTIDDTSASVPGACFEGDGDGGGSATNNVWTVMASGSGVAQSAEAEISPVSVLMDTAAQSFSYYIEPVIGTTDSGFDLIRIDVPSVYSNASPTTVSVNGAPMGFTDLSTESMLKVRLSSRVTVSGTDVRVDFVADTPAGVDWGRPFTSSLDDFTYPGQTPVACTSGDGDGGGSVVGNTWTVSVTHVEGRFTQNTWLDGQEGSVSNVYLRDETRLLLEGNDTNLVMIHEFPDPAPHPAGSLDRIYDMEVYQDKLYMSLGREVMWSSGYHLYDYDSSGAFNESLYISSKSGLLFLRTIGDYLYAPRPDTSGSSIPEAHRFDGSTWDGVFLEGTQTDGEHIIDIVSFQDRLLLDIHTFDRYVLSFDPDDVSGTSSPATPYDVEFYDNELDATYDIYRMLEYHDNLYVAAGGVKTNGYSGQHYVRLVRWNGTDVTRLHLDPTNSPPYRDKQTKAMDLEIFNDELYFSTYDSVYRYDEVTETAEKVAEFPLAWTVHDLQSHGGKLYAVVREDELLSSHGGADAHLFFNFAGLDDVENGQVWVSDVNGENWQALTTTLPVDIAYALESYRGRLFVGGGYENEQTPEAKYARLFAFPYRESGQFVSRAVDSGIDDVLYSQLLYNCETQSQTTVSFQLRTASSEGGLAGATFVGPDGTAGSTYTTSGSLVHSSHTGERWFQYAVYLTTTDPTNQTPTVDSVTITFSDGIKVDNLPVSNVTASNATLNGLVAVASGADTVYICWGDEDGGTVSTGNWDHVDFIGTGWAPGQTFSNTVATTGPTYYRAYMKSATDEDWADIVQVFTYSYALPFVETFESAPDFMAGVLGAVAGQHGWTDAASAALVQNAEAWEFDQAARVPGTSLSHTFEDGRTNVWTVFAWKPVQGALDVGGVPADATVVFWVNEGSTLSAYSNQTAVDTGTAVDTSLWCRIQVHSDYAAKEWSLWKDGTQVVDTFGFYSDTLSGLAGVRFRAYGDSVVYVDDVRIGTDAWNPQPGDTDGDNLLDDWELLYFKSPNVSDGAGDYDSDGSSDGDEDIAGTDPTDDTSLFTISNVTVNAIASNIVLHWPSVSGRLYAVDGRSNLLEGSWSNIESNIPPTTPENAYTVQVDSAEVLLNRIRVRKE